LSPGAVVSESTGRPPNSLVHTLGNGETAVTSLVAVIELMPAQRFQYSLFVALFKRYQIEDTIGESHRAAHHRRGLWRR
jgi:hypothetical protein